MANIEIDIIKNEDGLFTHYRMTPTLLAYMPGEMHLATSTYSEYSDMTFVSFATYYHDLPTFPGAWYQSKEDAEHAIRTWAEILVMYKNYKTMQHDLLPPF